MISIRAAHNSKESPRGSLSGSGVDKKSTLNSEDPALTLSSYRGSVCQTETGRARRDSLSLWAKNPEHDGREPTIPKHVKFKVVRFRRSLRLFSNTVEDRTPLLFSVASYGFRWRRNRGSSAGNLGSRE